MKKINLIFAAFLSLGGLFFSSCSDTTDPVIGATVPAQLNAPASDTFVLTQENENEAMTTLSWTAASFGAQVAIDYNVQMDLAGNGFAAPILLGNTIETSMELKAGEINKQLINLGLPADQPADVELRVVSSIGTISSVMNYESGYSNVIALHITPFTAEKVYPMLYLPGAHQDWKPDTAAPIYSVNNDGIYEGYVQLGGEFKFTSQTDWNGTNYGLGAAEGQLSTDGGAGNLTVDPGYYYIKVDVNGLTYSIKPMNWGLIGDATPNGWDADTPLAYDPATMTLRADVKLTDGAIKFRANGDWTDNFGGALEALVPGGDNIAVTAGDYTVVLDLHAPVYEAKLIAK